MISAPVPFVNRAGGCWEAKGSGRVPAGALAAAVGPSPFVVDYAASLVARSTGLLGLLERDSPERRRVPSAVAIKMAPTVAYALTLKASHSALLAPRYPKSL